MLVLVLALLLVLLLVLVFGFVLVLVAVVVVVVVVFCGVAGRCVKDCGTPDLVQEVFGTKSHKSHTGHTLVTHQSHTSHTLKNKRAPWDMKNAIFFDGTCFPTIR